MEEYYFVSYAYRRLGQTEQIILNKLISVHPLLWLTETLSKYGDQETYKLISWQVIDRYKYDKYKDCIE